MTQITLTQQLHHIFNSTEQDLDANQQGELSANQRRTLRLLFRPSRRMSLVISVSTILLITVFFPSGLWQRASDPLRLVLFMGVVILILVALALTDRGFPYNNGLRLDLKAKRVNVVVGQPYLKPPKRVERITYYELVVTDWNLFLTQAQYEQFQALVDSYPGQDYAFFFLPYSKLVMAVCPVSLDAQDFFVEA